MAFLFGNRKKSPQELIQSTLRNIQVLDDKPDDEKVKKSTEKISANLAAMKLMLYGDGETDPKPENIEKLVVLLFQDDALFRLISHIKLMEFEAKKDLAQVFNFLLRRGKQNQGVNYILEKKEIMEILVTGYDEPEIALNCGSILRECIRHEELANMLLQSDLFNNFFDYVQKQNFDVASDAFATFKMVLTKHKALAAKFLSTNYDRFFVKYNELIMSPNYVTKRQSLKLLGEIILDRSNFDIMMKYINDPDNLKIMMNLLRGNSKTIQFEAFHVFKVFVANPNKTAHVLEILLRNKVKLIEFLTKFKSDKDTDQFNEEKELLLATLAKLEEPTTPMEPPAAAPAAAAAP